MAINSTEEAYNATCREAWGIVNSCIASIESRITEGEVTEEDLSAAIRQAWDDSLIYTVSHYVCVWGLQDQSDAIEEGLCTPSNFGEALASQAYVNLEAAVSEHDFSDAFAVRSDMEAESSE
jgi:hypothetical protein